MPRQQHKVGAGQSQIEIKTGLLVPHGIAGNLHQQLLPLPQSRQ